MKIRYQCSNCGQRFQSSAMVGVPDGMYLSGCRVVGDAFYCEECVKTWAERNGAEFDKQYKDPVGMFTRWWNRMVDRQAEAAGKTVKRYHVLPNGDYAGGIRRMRHCEECGFLGYDGYEYPESYCTVGVREDDPKFDEDSQGCGCRYNLRTLRKMQKENDHAEYLCNLGYDNFMLMPTMEYTEENKKILERHRELIRHALGMDNRKSYIRHGKRFYRPYRNYFFTTERTVDFPYWERMVKANLAEKEERPKGINYFVTRRGMDWLGQHDGITIYNEKR